MKSKYKCDAAFEKTCKMNGDGRQKMERAAQLGWEKCDVEQIPNEKSSRPCDFFLKI